MGRSQLEDASSNKRDASQIPVVGAWLHTGRSVRPFFQANFRFLCNPRRPAVCGRFGPPEDKMWRFEFVVASDEDGMEMSQRHNVRKIMSPYLTHPGSRYG